jgi:hypothetical protein
MKQRGRKSVEAKTLKPVDVSVRRLPPPGGLTAEQATVWQSVTGCYPAGYFRPSERDLLAMYCKHVCEAWKISELIETIPVDKIKETDEGMSCYLKLMKARDTETRAATSLARAMRITHQSRATRNGAQAAVEQAEADAKPKPWEFQ